MKNSRNKIKKILSGILVFLVIIAAASAIYLGNYYHASDEAAAIAENALHVHSEHRDFLIFGTEELSENSGSSEDVLIFYPGGKVEMEAYAPLCSEIAEQGILCVLVEMPFNLAVFDMSAASYVQEYMSENYGCSDFCIGGHSLGGAIASYYAYDHGNDIEGLVLLGAYSGKDLSSADLRVLSVYGSEDQVLSADKYKESIQYMPEDFTEVVLEGGCHSWFGSYGMQKGDGTPVLSNEEQISMTADLIAGWIKQSSK